MAMMFCDISEQLVTVPDVFLDRLGGNLVSHFRIVLRKDYSKHMVYCPVALTRVSGFGAMSPSWRSDG